MQMRATVRRRQVVLAEDDRDMRNLLAQNLRRAGISVVEATDGSVLLDKLNGLRANCDQELPDLIVSDVHMPGKTGLEALDQFRREYPEVPIIIITAFGDAETVLAAQALGAVAVFDKPFDLLAFRETVINLLGY